MRKYNTLLDQIKEITNLILTPKEKKLIERKAELARKIEFLKNNMIDENNNFLFDDNSFLKNI